MRRTNERNQKNAGISGEINVMRQFDSSHSGAGVGKENRSEGNRDLEILSSSATVCHCEIIGFFGILTSVIHRDRSMRGRVSR